MEKRIEQPRKSVGLKKANQIPADILESEDLNREISWLPSNYNFEIHKTVWKIRQATAKCVALQFPEGLQMFALTISDIIEKHTGAETVILGDVTYGACCVDDFTARSLGSDFLVHYGHSCLVPISCTKGIKTLYVFVDIQIDVLHFVNSVQSNFTPGLQLAIVSTVQFVKTLHAARNTLMNDYKIIVPQSKPLTSGEILGCTAPRLGEVDALIYLGDGRFHLEAIMIANPSIPAYRYDPYTKELSHEYYGIAELLKTRLNSINLAQTAQLFGIILGTLGRQGNVNVMMHIKNTIQQLQKRFVIILLSEIFPAKLELFEGIDAWIQTACPRLSIDWGTAFAKPLLNPYEAATTLKEIEWKTDYPMDYYAYGSLGKWTPNHKTV